MKIRTLCAAAVLAALVSSPAYAEFTREEIETIVHDYIVNNPDVLIEASAKVQARQAELKKAEESKTIERILKSKQFPQSGPANAKHTIVEFFDYNCGYCKKAKPLLIDLLKHSPDTRYIYMEFPILSEISLTGARVGLAVYNLDKDKYVRYNNELMTRTGRLSNEIELQTLVESLGLNWKTVLDLSKKEEVDEILAEIRAAAQALEVNGTPAFIIDGQVLHGAPRSENDVKKLLKK